MEGETTVADRRRPPSRRKASAMTKQPKLEMTSDGTDVFLVLGGKRIAKRGRPRTQHAKQWIVLEPSVVVRETDCPGEIIVEIDGVVAASLGSKAERGDIIPLGVAVADGMAMVHGEGGEVWFQSLPAADNIEPCSCGAFARSPHYRLKEGFSARLIADG
jgi:hypothetical protein